MHAIKFYQTDKAYGCFSNFSKHPVHINSKLWPTTEHYFQAMKFQGTYHEDEILAAKTPMEAAQMGREKTRPLRSDWNVVKDSIMKEAILAKIDQHQDVSEILLSTADCQLIEHTANDSYWGDGGDGTGKNRLGEILMEVRDRMNKAEQYLLPPWLEFPDIEPEDLFWRMGKGEGYLNVYWSWHKNLSENARQEYDLYFRSLMPKDWAEEAKWSEQ